MSKIIQGKFKILSNKKAGPGYFKMAIAAPQIVKGAQPGQFVHLRCQEGLEPLLRRPLSFHRINRHSFEILYKIVGAGTNILAKLHSGDKIDVLGPLGNGFKLLGTANKSRTTNDPSTALRAGVPRTTILVAGGMGAAPLLALAEKLVDSPKHKAGILVLLGARNKQEVICAQDFRKLGAKVQVATDDGTMGYKGLVTDLLNNLLRTTSITQTKAGQVNRQRVTGHESRATIYACGPKLMLKEISSISKKARIAAQGSLEEHIACGVGACVGCVVKTKQGYQRVCKDGPVFDLNQIVWC